MTFEEQFTKDYGNLDPDGIEKTQFEDLTVKARDRIKNENITKIVEVQDACARLEESVLYYAMAMHRLREWEKTYMVANAAIRAVEEAPVMRDPVDIPENGENSQ